MNFPQNLFLNQPPISLLDYLDFEEKSERRHEYHAGKVRPLSLKTIEHSRISVNLMVAVSKELTEQNMDYDALSNVKISHVNTTSVVYPDLMITSGEIDFPIPNR